MPQEFFADLVRSCTVNGREASPQDLDRAFREIALAHSWAQARHLDLVSAICAGLMTAVERSAACRELPY